MKNYLLLAGAALIGWGEPAFAAIDCAVPPTCDELGYAYSSAECYEQTILKCPFDDTKVYCSEPIDPYDPVTCKVGSVLYNDLKCYVLAPSGKTAVGIVFDTTKRLAVALDETSSVAWGSSSDFMSTDLIHLSNCNLQSGQYQECQSSGRSNTDAIAASMQNGDLITGDLEDYAANICMRKRDGVEWKPSGTFEDGMSTSLAGPWFMPSISELYTLYSVKDQINDSLSAVGGTPITSSTWSSDEFNNKYAIVIGYDGSTASLEKDKKSNVRCAIDY